MNKLKLKEATQAYVIYLYYPDGKDKYGEIRMDIGDEEANVTTRADLGNEITSGSYAFKAAKAVKECVQERNFPLEFTQAWY
ncbi:MAG: hypothetical protein FWH05_00510 [Oscillospiraceae bacterium]|nr:hypothetical protein [Oscillospiraceae bacterium]